MSNTQHTPAFKVEYQQYEDGTHVCLATQSGDWVADFGKEGNRTSEKNAKLFADLLKERDKLKAELIEWRQGGNDEFIRRRLVKSESLNSELLEALKYAVDTEYDRREDSRNFEEDTLSDWAKLVAKAEWKGGSKS